MTGEYETYELVWSGIRIEVRYAPSWLECYERIYGYPLAHLEIRSVNPKDTPLPLTQTGYRSHFMAAEEVEEAGGPLAYVRSALDEAAKSPAWQEAEAKAQQLSLFSICI